MTVFESKAFAGDEIMRNDIGMFINDPTGLPHPVYHVSQSETSLDEPREEPSADTDLFVP